MEIAYFCMSFLISLVTTAQLSFLLLSNSQTKLPFNAQALSFQLGLGLVHKGSFTSQTLCMSHTTNEYNANLFIYITNKQVSLTVQNHPCNALVSTDPSSASHL